MPRRNFDIIDGDQGTITVATGGSAPENLIRYEGRIYARTEAFQEKNGTWIAVYRELTERELDVSNLWDEIFYVNGGELYVFQHSMGKDVPPTKFVRFRRPETPSVPLVYSQPPQVQEDEPRGMNIYLSSELGRIIYGAATSAGRFIPAYFPGMDTRAPEGLGFPGRLVLAPSLPGAKKK